MPREAGVSTHCNDHQIVAPVARVGSRLTEGADRTVDEAGIPASQGFPAQPALSQGAGFAAFEYDVCVRDQLQEGTPTLIRVEVDGDSALARIEREPRQASLGIRSSPYKGPPPARGVALRRLQLDDVGAHVAENLSGQKS
jgi:hypothetical protein